MRGRRRGLTRGRRRPLRRQQLRGGSHRQPSRRRHNFGVRRGLHQRHNCVIVGLEPSSSPYGAGMVVPLA